MRILCVGTDFPPRGSGGYELQSAGFAAHARAAGHAVRVVCAGPSRASGDRAADVHRDLVRFPARPEPVAGAAARRSERRNRAALAGHLRAFRPDVVCWWRLGELSMSLPGLVARAGVPAVGVVCDAWPVEGPERDPWARLTGTGPDPAAARWLIVSRSLRARLAAAGVPVGAAPVVTPGVETYAFRPAPAGPWRWRLLYAGRLSSLKGVDVAVRALAHLPACAQLALVGAGAPADVARLRALAAELGVGGRMTLHRPRPPAAMRAAYAAADAVLFPSRWPEPWGLVPLEAMAVGRPVVASGTGGSAEYMRAGANALLARAGSARAVADAVRRLAADPLLRDRLVAGGRRTAAAHPAERSHAAVLAAVVAAARAEVAAPVGTAA